MSEIKNRNELLKDLQLIKEAASKNRNIFKYVPLAKAMKNVALVTGIIIIVLSLVLLWISSIYGSFEESPAALKTAIFSFIVLCCIGLPCYKIRSILKLTRKYKKDMSLMNLMKEVYTKTFLLNIIPLLISIIVLCIYLPLAGLSHLLVPVITIFIALILTSMLVLFNLKNFLLSCEWLLLSGLFSLFISELVSPYVILIITLGAGMLILYLSAQYSISREKRD